VKPEFERIHPFSCFYFYGSYLLFSMLFLHPLFLLTSFVGVIVLTLLHGAGQQLKSSLPFYLFMGGMIAIMNPLFNHRGLHILFYMGDQPITLEAVLYGLIMMFSIWCIFLVFLSFNVILSAGRFLYLFSRLFQKGALLIMLAIRFVPLLKRRLGQLMTVQKTRGINPLEGSLSKRLKDGMTILQVLVTWSLEEAFQTAESMTARGFGASPQRSSYVRYRWNRENRIVLLFLIVTSIGCLVGWTKGVGTFVVYPVMKTPSWTPETGVYYICYLLFILTPIFIEGREKLKWRLLK